MDAPPPGSERLTLQDWGVIVAIVTGTAGALYAAWRIVMLPALRVAARRILQTELEALERNNAAIGRIWAEHFEQRDLLQRIEEGQRELRDMVMKLQGRGER